MKCKNKIKMVSVLPFQQRATNAGNSQCMGRGPHQGCLSIVGLGRWSLGRIGACDSWKLQGPFCLCRQDPAPQSRGKVS